MHVCMYVCICVHVHACICMQAYVRMFPYTYHISDILGDGHIDISLKYLNLNVNLGVLNLKVQHMHAFVCMPVFVCM